MATSLIPILYVAACIFTTPLSLPLALVLVAIFRAPGLGAGWAFIGVQAICFFAGWAILGGVRFAPTTGWGEQFFIAALPFGVSGWTVVVCLVMALKGGSQSSSADLPTSNETTKASSYALPLECLV